MTVFEASQKAGVSDTVIKRWLKRGDVRGRKEHGQWTVEAASLDAYLNKPRLRGRPRKEAT